jgi:peptidoglycan hydrolase-like protein with peptidoglycan-binding domain
LLVAVALAAGAAGWAGHEVLAPPEPTDHSSTVPTVAVTEGTVSATLPISVAASWDIERDAYNAASGVITTIEGGVGDAVADGQRLYSVDARPVFVGQGELPAYGDLDLGQKGAAVEQLQRFLADQGHFGGIVDGVFGAATDRAVRNWQKTVGLPVDGVVRQADIVWVPVLPARLVLDTQTFGIGRTVSAGVGKISILRANPGLHAVFTEEQAQQVSPGTAVRVTSPGGGQWDAIILSVERAAGEESMMEGALTAPDETSAICGDECDQIPVATETMLVGEVVTVPEASGLVVPTSAVRTSADGHTILLAEDGTEVPVQVIQSARGTSLIEGVPAGTVVRIPAER